jgi:hypothetical protein
MGFKNENPDDEKLSHNQVRRFGIHSFCAERLLFA